MRFLAFILIGFLSVLVLPSDAAAATPISSCTVISSPGIYVLNQSITNSPASACINITSSNVTFDGAGYTIDGVDTANTYGVYVYNSSIALTNVTVKNAVITDWDLGIFFKNASNGNIADNKASSSVRHGIFLQNSNLNKLTNNTLLNNFGGIVLYYSDSNALNANNASSNGDGIDVHLSNNNSLINNTVSSNSYGIWVNLSNGNTITENTVLDNTNTDIGLYSSASNTLDRNTVCKTHDDTAENYIGMNTCPSVTDDVIQVTTEDRDEGYPDITFDYSNNLWVASQRWGTGGTGIWMRKWNGSWSYEISMSPPSGSNERLELAVDKNNRVWWIEEGNATGTNNWEIYGRYYDNDFKSEIFNISNDSTSLFDRDPTATVDKNGNVWVAWNHYAAQGPNPNSEQFVRVYNGTSWLIAKNVTNTTNYAEYKSSITSDSNGRIWLAYLRVEGSIGNESESIYAIYTDDNGTTWQGPFLVASLGPGLYTMRGISATISANNRIDVVWASNQTGVWEVYRGFTTNNGTSWNISQISLDLDYNEYPEVAYDNSTGLIWYVWVSAKFGSYSDLVARYENTSTNALSAKIFLTNGSYRDVNPKLVAKNGTLWITFSSYYRTGNWDIFVKRVNESLHADPPSITVYNPSPVEKGSSANLTINIAEPYPDTYKVYRNSTVVASGKYAGGIAFNVSINTSMNGIWNYTVWANDTAGNNASISALVTVQDATPPSITIASPQNTTYNTSSVELKYSVFDLGSITSVNYTLDGGSNISLTANTTMCCLLHGQHVLEVYATDDAGNTGYAGVAFTIDIILVSNTTNVNTTFDNATNLTASYAVGFVETFGNVSLDIITAQEVNGTLNITAYRDTPTTPLNQSTGLGGNERAGRKYAEFNATSNVIGNLSWVILRIYYTGDEVSGLNENTLKLYRHCSASNTWQSVVKASAPYNITCGGQNITVYDTGINTTSSPRYLYANLSGFSLYGIAGEIAATSQTSTSTGGGGGGGAAPPAIAEGIQSLGLSLMKSIVEELGLKYKFFYRMPNTLASVFALVGDVVGEWPAPRLGISSIITRPITALEGDVYELAVARVKKRWVSAPAVVIARGDLEVDSMAAVAYAKARGYPILLTKSNLVPSVVLDEIKSLSVSKIIIAGGPVAVSSDVESQLSGTAPVERIWGRNREETAVKLAEALEKIKVTDTIVVADGLNAAPEATIIAAGYRAPIVYVTGDTMPEVTRDFLVDHKATKDAFKKRMKVVFVGISDKAQKEIEALMK